MAEKLTKAEERYWRKMADEPLGWVRVPQEVQDALAAGVPFPSRLGTPTDYAKLVKHIVENDMLSVDSTIRHHAEASITQRKGLFPCGGR